MKILMFGWEFPPHISGGLGTACYGLTKGLTSIHDTEIMFVVPKAFGDEDEVSKMRILSAEEVNLKDIHLKGEEFLKKITFIGVNSKLVPYMGPEEFEKYFKLDFSKTILGGATIPASGKFSFQGGYGASLFMEIYNYSIIAAILASENYFDVIHAHDWLTYPAGIVAKEISGKPLVIHVHATDFDRSGGNINPDVYRIERMGMEAADRIITVSNLTRDTVIHKYGIDPKKVITVYNAVEPIDMDNMKFLDRTIDEKIVTFLGRITMQKGPEYFIEAAYKVLQRMDNVRFVMAGSGDMMDKMVRRAARLKITDKFHFTGFLKGDDVYNMFSMSDVYVMPSISEPFGISPLEAMLSNVPVIISYQSGVAEVLKHALKINFWDIDAMADAIYGVLNYPALTKMFRSFGKDEVEKLRWENTAKHVRKIYTDII